MAAATSRPAWASTTSRDTSCELLWRGVAANRSRVVFHGGIQIREGADGTDANLSNKNLLLSADAEIDTQPTLVIDADEVKAARRDRRPARCQCAVLPALARPAASMGAGTAECRVLPRAAEDPARRAARAAGTPPGQGLAEAGVA
jgi:hypothetical protein